MFSKTNKTIISKLHFLSGTEDKNTNKTNRNRIKQNTAK